MSAFDGVPPAGFLTVACAADRLGMSVTAVRLALRQRRLRGRRRQTKWGPMWFVREDSVAAFARAATGPRPR